MQLAYNTNGLAHHRLDEALQLCAELGYGGVAITLDVPHLDPLGDWRGQAKRIGALAVELGLDLAVETGARYLLDARRKHAPNLLASEAGGRNRRVDFYRRSIDVAVEIGAPLISLWSGAHESGDSISDDSKYARLTEGLIPVLEHAAAADVLVAFEPEPGMFIERVDQYHTLKQRADGALQSLRMTLDVGHCLVTQEIRPEHAISANPSEIVHVHLDDIQDNEHEHVMFGRGDLNLSAVLRALDEVAFTGMAAVELSRDSHRGAWAAEEALRCLTEASR